MYRQITLLFGAALLGLVHAQHPQITAAPGKMTKRQIKPKTIEIHHSYAAPIGVDTEYLTMEGSTTKASEGVEVGDVTVLLSETVQQELDKVVKEAAASCGTGAKLRKRDTMDCLIDALRGAAENEETLSLTNAAEWENFALELAENARSSLGGVVQVFKTQALRNRFALLVAGAASIGLWAANHVVEPAIDVAHKFVFDGGLFGLPNEDSDENDDSDPTSTEKTASTSVSTCNPTATVDENSPACDDADCEGKKKVCQAEGEKKNCPCVKWTKKMTRGYFDKDWSDEQQKILKELEAGLPDVIPPQCFRNTNGDGFDGKPKAEPSAFCHCSSAKAGGGMTKGNFPTMTGEGDKACTYSTMPTQTISITMRPKETTMTSCRLESSYDLDPYCTCNDDLMRGQITTTYLGNPTTVCPDAVATMTIEDGTPTEEPSCYPTHGPPHDDPEVDELIKLCAAGWATWGIVCRDPNTRIRVSCPGGALENWFAPTSNNEYHAWFEKAEDAPEDCDYLFGQNGSDDDDAVGARIDALCEPPFQAIRDKCTWNGGEVKNQCGTFKYQSCPRGHDCQPGSPGG
ncbi:hypothetical protein UCREL1_9579 [Eutypa lata UCREL1]|uniref:Uncharacterized protein n=1 Tax=Eutypa lata (strain UCR-EL1) TaxID=1287681 RepID=M7SGS7_EUTLA|nr:hypothetical protein UCREL1_9579 [Eutypa lata UCREL1]